jgi:hypothetical protein
MDWNSDVFLVEMEMVRVRSIEEFETGCQLFKLD